MMSANESTPTLISWLVFNPNRDAQHGRAPRMPSLHAAVLAKVKELAPYAAILILPGGSVMAFLLWLYRRQKQVNQHFYTRSMR